MIDALPEAPPASGIDARYREIKGRGRESLRELRKGCLARPAGPRIAATPEDPKQPSVSQDREGRPTCICRTLRSYVEAIGGELDLVGPAAQHVRAIAVCIDWARVFSGPAKAGIPATRNANPRPPRSPTKHVARTA